MTTGKVPDLTMDPLQRAAAEAGEGPMVILGGPGTGKTHTLVARIALLLRGGASPHSITCLTFSARGAEALQRQLEDLPPTAGAAPHIFAGTIHSYASLYLRRAGAGALGLSPQFTIWDAQQSLEVMGEILEEENPAGEKPGAAEIAEILDWSRRNAALAPEEAEAPREAHWPERIARYRREKRRQNVLDLDDLIPWAIEAMEREPETRAVWNRTRSRHLLVDEFQDVTPRQYHLLRLMTGPTRSITVAADPNQSIYRWRGADPKLLEQFRLDHGPDLRLRMLRINHRATRTLAEVATALTGAAQLPGLTPDYQQAIRIAGPEPTLTTCDDRPEVMDRRILEWARQLVEEGSYRWQDLACIYRTHRTLHRLLTQVSSENIPHTILGETQQNRDGNARSIAAILNLALNPMDRRALALAASLETRNRNRRLNRELTNRVSRLAEERGTHLVDAAAAYLERLKPGTPAQAGLQYVVRTWQELHRLLEDPATELYDLCRRANRRLLEAQHAIAPPEPGVFRLLALSQTLPRLGQESPRELLARFLELQAAALQPDYRSTENDNPFREPEGMTLATIHAAKGQQWPVVWVVDADDRHLPYRRRQQDETDRREEERVFYVAATRATDQLHFCCATRTGKGDDAGPSPFLEALEDLLERRPPAAAG